MIKDEFEKDNTRRIGDVQIAALITRFNDFVLEVNKKLDNGINKKLDDIWIRIVNLPCGVHTERLENMKKIDDDRCADLNNKIKGLYTAFIAVVIVGIVIGVWLKFITP